MRSGASIAEADEPREIGRAHSFPLGECGKRLAIAAHECGIEPARLDQQLDESCIGFRCGKRVGPLDQHPDYSSTAVLLGAVREIGEASRKRRRSPWGLAISVEL